MRFRTIGYAIATLLATIMSASAQNAALQSGEIYIISRDGHYVFRGSHQIFSKKADDLVQVEYCGQSYWVRYATVAWTELEVLQKFDVTLEVNWGKGWRPICKNPEEQVTLAKLGIDEDPRLILQNDGSSVRKKSRFSTIRSAFGDRNKGSHKSYHRQ